MVRSCSECSQRSGELLALRCSGLSSQTDIDSKILKRIVAYAQTFTDPMNARSIITVARSNSPISSRVESNTYLCRLRIFLVIILLWRGKNAAPRTALKINQTSDRNEPTEFVVDIACPMPNTYV